VNRFVLDFIEAHASGDKPFFAYYPMMLPHAPFVPTPRTKGAKGWREQDPRYFRDMVEYTDELVGRVVDKLEQLGLRENTLVIFLGDNGTNRDVTSTLVDGTVIRGGKGQTTDYGTHVPMIVSWPGTVPAGFVSEGLVDFSDILPTLHAVAGYRPDANRIRDGVNLLPVLHGERPTTREWIYSWYAHDEGVEDVTPDNVEIHASARTARFHLYRDGRFFDVLNDPLEKRDLSGTKLSTATVAVKAMLQGAIDRYQPAEAAR
jgi:arylsulfatase A